MTDYNFDDMLFDEMQSINDNTQYMQEQIVNQPNISLQQVMQKLNQIQMTQQLILSYLQGKQLPQIQQEQHLQPTQPLLNVKIWSEEDKSKFVQALTKTNKSNIALIQQHFLPQKSHKQIISYSQKFFQKLKKSLITTSPNQSLDEQKFFSKIAELFQTLNLSLADNVVSFVNEQFKRQYKVINCPCDVLCRINDSLQQDITFINSQAIQMLKAQNFKYSIYEVFVMFSNVLVNSCYNIVFTIKFLSQELYIQQEFLYLLLFIYFAQHPRRTILIKENCVCGGTGEVNGYICSCSKNAPALK